MTTIFPTRYFLSLCAVLAAIGYAALSQNNGPAYLLGFALLAVSLVSVVHSWANLRGLHVAVARFANGFAGKPLAIPFTLRNKSPKTRYGIRLSSAHGADAVVSKIAREEIGELRLSAGTRGRYRVPEIRISTVFPFGIFRVTKKQGVTCEYCVYPEPKGKSALPLREVSAVEEVSGRRGDGDDFSGVRGYIAGESQRHIDWKAVARGQPFLVKQFEGGEQNVITFEWAQTAGEVEDRLSQLSLWIVEAQRLGLQFGLKLPETAIEPASGTDHFHRCMCALASHEK